MLDFVESRVTSAPYSLPQIKCINCNMRIPTKYWMEYLKYPSKSHQKLDPDSENTKWNTQNEEVSQLIRKCKTSFDILWFFFY